MLKELNADNADIVLRLPDDNTQLELYWIEDFGHLLNLSISNDRQPIIYRMGRFEAKQAITQEVNEIGFNVTRFSTHEGRSFLEDMGAEINGNAPITEI